MATKAALIVQETLEAIQFDASISETHTNTAEVTQHPVETGVNISDHIRSMPEELEINVIVTNHPPIILASLRALPISGFGDPRSRAEDSHEFIRNLMKTGTIVRFITTLREYSNMAITSMSVVRDKDTGNIANINLSLKEVITSESTTIESEPKNAGRKKKKNLGKQIKTSPNNPTQEKSKSLLFRIFDATGKATSG